MTFAAFRIRQAPAEGPAAQRSSPLSPTPAKVFGVGNRLGCRSYRLSEGGLSNPDRGIVHSIPSPRASRLGFVLDAGDMKLTTVHLGAFRAIWDRFVTPARGQE
jgi:hypothetical protein